jgi:hypothetical protein
MGNGDDLQAGTERKLSTEEQSTAVDPPAKHKLLGVVGLD